MSTQAPSPERAALNEPAGWFAAGRSFREALTLLSDGAFKLFAYICLEADRKTGRFEATQNQLAAAVGKSKRIIGRYVAELEKAHVCTVTAATNQHRRTTLEICEAFWPYRRIEVAEQAAELRQYVDTVRADYLSLGECTSGSFGAADAAVARNLYERRVALGVALDAMLVGACRKYVSWLNGAASQPIQSLRYFESLITEIQEQPLPPGYSGYLRRKVKQFAAERATRPTPGEHSPAPDGRQKRDSAGGFPQSDDLLGKKGTQQTAV
jgi:hypothetical protein